MNEISPSKSVPSIPIQIGVTGHRDPAKDDVARLKQAVNIELQRIKSACEGKEWVTRIVLMSALAEGSDRLVAKIAIDLGIGLLAVLPMPQLEYEKDFSNTGTLDEFHELLRKAERIVELPLIGDHLDSIAPFTKVERVLQYEQLGLFIASNCHFLLALWDGVDLPNRGGTSNVVSMRIGRPGQANPTIFYSRLALPIGYGTQILTPRQGESFFNGVPYTRKPIIPDSWKPRESANDLEPNAVKIREQDITNHAWKIFFKIVSNTNELNVDIQKQVRNGAIAIEQSRDHLFKGHEGIPLDEAARQYVEDYCILDSLANRFRAKRVRTITALFALIVTAFLWFELHTKIFPHLRGLPQDLPIWGYLVLLTSIILVYMRAKRGRYDEKHEDYRVLAEALRVQIVWQLAGATEVVTHHCVPRQVGELSWIRLALFGFTYPYAHRPTINNPNIEYVRVEWVEGQSSWYDRRRGEQSRSVERVARMGGVLLIICASVSLLLCIPILSPLVRTEGLQFWVIEGLVMLVATLLATAAARHGYVEMLAWAEQTHQYDRMRNVFELANKTLLQLKDSQRLSDMQQVVLTLGKEALAEHGDWLIMHRARPLEVPRL